MPAVGIVLAAGAGTRYGRPKASVVEQGVSWLALAVDALAGGGCAEVVVVLGAETEQSRTLLDGDVRVVVAEDWQQGMSASLRRGLEAIAGAGPEVDRVVVHLVDLPDVGAAVVDRVLAAAPGRGALARATYDGRPGHPVVLGRDHWAAVAATVTGDRGAGAYLAEHGATRVECGDLASGRDHDRQRHGHGDGPVGPAGGAERP